MPRMGLPRTLASHMRRTVSRDPRLLIEYDEQVIRCRMHCVANVQQLQEYMLVCQGLKREPRFTSPKRSVQAPVIARVALASRGLLARLRQRERCGMDELRLEGRLLGCDLM